MAQDRMLRQSMRTSEKVNSWPIPLRYFWTQLWGYCDDHGRGRYDSRLIVADTFPIDDDVTAAVVGRWMQALEMAGVIRLYEVDSKSYFECVNWPEHQELKYVKRTDIPDSSGTIPTIRKHSEKFSNVSEKSVPREEKRREVEIEGEGKKDTTPTPFCAKHPQGTDAPCRACQAARVGYEKPKQTVPGIITPEDCKTHPGRPAKGCDRCAEERAK